MNILPTLRTGRLIVIYAPDAARTESMILIAELGLRGAVTILDGGNRYQPYQVATLLRRKTANISPAANRLFSRRAFTCYEVNTLLGSTPSLLQPYVILDLLNTFYDDHVPTYEAYRLLKSCLGQIQRLLLSGPVVVTLAPPLADARDFRLNKSVGRRMKSSSRKCLSADHPNQRFSNPIVWAAPLSPSPNN